jgi:hypothetical protein
VEESKEANMKNCASLKYPTLTTLSGLPRENDTATRMHLLTGRASSSELPYLAPVTKEVPWDEGRPSD